MLQLYLKYKEQHIDRLLFFQVGDFYELFFDDAKTAANALNLTLTSRDKSSASPIPMCGVPVAVLDEYLEKLLDLGFSAAVVSQVSGAPDKSANSSSGKKMVERELERVVSPGLALLNSDSERVAAPLVAVYRSGMDEYAYAATVLASGVIDLRSGLSLVELIEQLRLLELRELVIPRLSNGESVDLRTGWIRELRSHLGAKLAITFSNCDLSSLSKESERCDLSLFDPEQRWAVRILLDYIDLATPQGAPSIVEVREDSSGSAIVLDCESRRHLEIVTNSKNGSNQGTLFEYLNQTKSAAGARALRHWLLHPLTETNKIKQRHEVLRYLLEHRELLSDLESSLAYVPDMERIALRLELHTVKPRELAALRDAFSELKKLHSANFEGGCKPKLLAKLLTDINPPIKIESVLNLRLAQNPPMVLGEGGCFKEGFDAELDRLLALTTRGSGLILELEAKEREATSIASLKIKYTSVFGYFIEVTKANLSKVPDHYIRKQTTANAERYYTEELKSLERSLSDAQRLLALRELKLFEELRTELLPFTKDLRALNKSIGALDVLQSFAHVAYQQQLSEPVVEDSVKLEIIDGKHPILAKRLEGDFQSNDLILDGDKRRAAVITGANMGGKSTYLRQAALITVMAQAGSFVPARLAKIGVVDRIFTRIGAADDLLEGESTFMVEMREAAQILSRATGNSLILIDELGRGTATSDGQALAQAILEYLVSSTKARLLFATHFHSLTALSDEMQGLINLSVGSVDHQGQIIFTHTIEEGPASRSYGLEVASLAGVKPEILVRATELLSNLPQNSSSSDQTRSNVEQLSFFAPASKVVEPGDYRALQELKQCIQKIDVNKITPIESILILSELVEHASGGEKNQNGETLKQFAENS